MRDRSKKPFIVRASKRMVLWSAVCMAIVLIAVAVFLPEVSMHPGIFVPVGFGERLLLAICVGAILGALLGLGTTRPDPPNKLVSIGLIVGPTLACFLLIFIAGLGPVRSGKNELADIVVLGAIISVLPAILCSIVQFASSPRDEDESNK